MSAESSKLHLFDRIQKWIQGALNRGFISAGPLTIFLSLIIGIFGGYGAILFTFLIDTVSHSTLNPLLSLGSRTPWAYILLAATPAVGLLFVSWFTRRFAPEAEGHGVPEVITAVARHDGVIRPRVAIVKILASGICIGTGGSVGREGPIVQIGSAVGSVFGQLFKLSARNIKVLVAAGAAAGISATFNAPLAGVIFASEIILGSFAVESITPIVIASVIADVVQQQHGEHGLNSAFTQVHYTFGAAWEHLPSYFLLGLVCGIVAVSFTKLVYYCEDLSKKYLPGWWARALVLGGMVGIVGVLYPATPPNASLSREKTIAQQGHGTPPLFGVGYEVVDHALHLRNESKKSSGTTDLALQDNGHQQTDKHVTLSTEEMLAELWWILPLVFLKPVMTSITLAGGGSGGIFAPSLFIGATVGASFGLVLNLLLPGFSANPGLYAIVGMGAVVAGTTHGVLSSILIVYELTNDYHIILPIMAAAGLASVLARFIDPESIYLKKISRRGESISRGEDLHCLEHIMVRDVMIRKFPTVQHTDNAIEIIHVARSNPHIESLPVMNEENQLLGIIRPEDLHRVLDSDISPQLVNASDIALISPIAVSPAENLLEALRDFGTRDVDTLPVVTGAGQDRKLIGLLLRSDVMSRYREELLRRR